MHGARGGTLNRLLTLVLAGLTLGAVTVYPAGGGAWAKGKPVEVPTDITMCKKLGGATGDEPIEPTSTFPKDAPVVNGAWRSKAGHEGAPWKVVWIAEDVGAAAPAGTKIDESKGALPGKQGPKDQLWWSGHFSLTRPTAGWPVGRYRVDLYLDDKLIKSVKFNIQ